jgi:hypothetical protein
VHHVHQIALRFHPRVDGLERHRSFPDFVDEVRIALAWSSKVKRRWASVREVARPAPWWTLRDSNPHPSPE